MWKKMMHLRPDLYASIITPVALTLKMTWRRSRPMWQKMMHLRSASLCILFLPHKKRRYIYA